MDVGLRGPSRTALMAAMGRALHRDGPPPHVLDDWMAADLAGEEGRAILDSMLANALPDRMHAFQVWTAVRSRFVEDFVDSAVTDGVSQYVMLGAGLDSFAYRHADRLERLTIFEVDHPFSQAWKRRRLDELGIRLPHNVAFAAVDFQTQSLSEALVASGFVLDRPAVVSWIGVTMYLARDSIDATLQTIARCAPGTRAVVSYDQPPDVLDEQNRAILAEVSGTAAKYGEPFISLFRRDEVEELLVEHGFDGVAHFGAEEAVVRYFGGQDVGVPDVQRLVTAVVAG
ncbi:MAG: class I SAM-dependent methyltransferase [Chloroflexi bacterium]|nr:class I SAM-dependent methyltransferase [Chloroflexota bacterium]